MLFRNDISRVASAMVRLTPPGPARAYLFIVFPKTVLVGCDDALDVIKPNWALPSESYYAD